MKCTAISIKLANFGGAFEIIGPGWLVIHRFSAKSRLEMNEKTQTGKAASATCLPPPLEAPCQ